MLTSWQKGLVLNLWVKCRERRGEAYDVMEQIRWNWPSLPDDERQEIMQAYLQRRKEMKVDIRCELGWRLYEEQLDDLATAKLFLDRIFKNETPKKITPDHYTAKGGVLVVKCDGLKGLIEMEASTERKLPDAYAKRIEAFLRGHWAKRVEEEKKPARAPSVVMRRKGLGNGMVTIQQMCERNKWEPHVARAVIRKAGWKKPDSGSWAWSHKEAPAVETKLKKIM